mmetsp:Transcript_82265/g.209077  ORF Transcript_82265/g.209077 Transcript_82265/m.209077 type:complete len:240 (-) Transcript_82265:3-722(-)
MTGRSSPKHPQTARGGPSCSSTCRSRKRSMCCRSAAWRSTPRAAILSSALRKVSTALTSASRAIRTSGGKSAAKLLCNSSSVGKLLSSTRLSPLPLLPLASLDPRHEGTGIHNLRRRRRLSMTRDTTTAKTATRHEFCRCVPPAPGKASVACPEYDTPGQGPVCEEGVTKPETCREVQSLSSMELTSIPVGVRATSKVYGIAPTSTTGLRRKTANLPKHCFWALQPTTSCTCIHTGIYD